MNERDLLADQRVIPEYKAMKCAIIASAVLLSTILSAQPSHAFAASHVRKLSASHASSSIVTYNRDSKDPNVGWHWERGMRVCHNDCDNPEIPGSGYTCRSVQAFGMPMRECDWSSQ
jgi:hypothetical protein